MGRGEGARRVGENEKSRWVRWSHNVSSDYYQHHIIIYTRKETYSKVIEELVYPRQAG
jgi:hypothetical protein